MTRYRTPCTPILPCLHPSTPILSCPHPIPCHRPAQPLWINTFVLLFKTRLYPLRIDGNYITLPGSCASLKLSVPILHHIVFFFSTHCTLTPLIKHISLPVHAWLPVHLLFNSPARPLPDLALLSTRLLILPTGDESISNSV